MIDPEPTPRFKEPDGPDSPYGTTAVDLRLGNFIQIPRPMSQLVVDLNAPGDVRETLTQISESITMDARGFRLEPRQFILAQTLETVSLKLPQELDGPGSERPVLAARVEGKSSRARFGLLIHFTAPTIHAG